MNDTLERQRHFYADEAERRVMALRSDLVRTAREFEKIALTLPSFPVAEIAHRLEALGRHAKHCLSISEAASAIYGDRTAPIDVRKFARSISIDALDLSDNAEAMQTILARRKVEAWEAS